MRRTYYVYIMASRKHGTLYIGVTNDVANRSAEHRAGVIPGFTQRYGVTRLVWPNEFLAQTIGIVAVLAAAVWAPNAAHALRPTLGWPWWQPALLALAAQVVPGLTLAAVRRASAPRTI